MVSLVDFLKNKTDNILIYQTHLLMVSLVNFLDIKHKKCFNISNTPSHALSCKLSKKIIIEDLGQLALRFQRRIFLKIVYDGWMDGRQQRMPSDAKSSHGLLTT